MNLAEFSIRNNRVVFTAMAFVLLGGVVAYNQLGRLEDPEFTIKEALIVTPYPGASAEEVAKEVTNPIETAIQQLGQLERVESESSRGRSVVIAVIKDQFDRETMPQVWDELRRRVADVQRQLPPSVRGQSVVVDDFGDVFGIFLAVTGEGYSSAELRRYAESLRRELLIVQDVEKVQLFAEQREVVFLQISRQRLAQLGFSEEQIYAQLQARNVAADGGRVQVGSEYPPLDPTGGFSSVDDMLDLVTGSDKSGRQLLLRDVASIERGDEDPPRRLLRYDGKAAIGLGISTVPGGNVVTMGKAVQRRLQELERNRPLGIEIGEINFQPKAVTEATNAFAFNLLKAVSIVFVVLLITMGLRAGTIIGGILFLTIMGTFLVMYLDGSLLMERISLGALIIALCMLTDNAIVVTEGMKVRMEAGEDKLAVARDVIAQNQWPLFGATSIAVVAFAAIGLSQDSTGEYVNSLFWVILISLALSWIAAITFTPLLCYLFFKHDPDSEGHGSYSGGFFQGYRRFLVFALRFRYAALMLTLGLFAAAVYGFSHIEQNFFPPATRPQFMVDTFLPAGSHIRESESYAETVGQYIQELPGVTHVTSFVGGGGLRFMLVYSPERENRAFVQFLVDVDDERSIEGLLTNIQAYIEANHPDANAVAKRFLLGPGGGGRVQARFSGPDPATLRALADQALRVFEQDGGAIGIRSDWREREKVIRPVLSEFQARRNGITRVEVAQALESGFEGRVVGFYREPGSAERGAFPQETRLLPILARPPLSERSDVGAISSMQIWSPASPQDDPLESGGLRGRGRMGRPDRDAAKSLPDQHRPRRPALRVAQPIVQPRAGADRADRATGGLFARMGRRARRFRQSAGGSRRVPPDDAPGHGLHRHLPVQFDPLDARHLRDGAARDHRRDHRPAGHEPTVRLHGAARCDRAGRRADQELGRAGGRSAHAARSEEVAVRRARGCERGPAATGAPGRPDDGAGNDPAPAGRVLLGDGGVHHVRTGLCLRRDHDHRAHLVLHLVSGGGTSERAVGARSRAWLSR